MVKNMPRNNQISVFCPEKNITQEKKSIQKKFSQSPSPTYYQLLHPKWQCYLLFLKVDYFPATLSEPLCSLTLINC